jgi:hypothetical protein
MGASEFRLQYGQPRYVRAHDRGRGILLRDRRWETQYVDHREVRVLMGELLHCSGWRYELLYTVMVVE